MAIPHAVVWENGGQVPWTRYWTCAALGVVGITTLLFLRGYRRPSSAEAFAIPAIALAIYVMVLFQAKSYRPGLGGLLSSSVQGVYDDWVPAKTWQALPADAIDVDHHPASVCAWSTQQAAIMPAMFGFASFLAAIAFNKKKTAILLLVISSVATSVYAFFGLVEMIRPQSMVSAEGMFAYFPKNSSAFGTFVNKNSAALYLNLGLGSTVGLLFYSVQTKARSRTEDRSFDVPAENVVDWVREFVARVLFYADAKPIAWLVLAVLQFSAILASNSRGGFLAALAGLAACTIAGKSNARRAWVLIPVIVSAIAVVLLIDHLNLAKVTRDRIESIFTPEDGSRVGRLNHWQDSLAAATHYLPMGSGLGTYAYAYLAFQSDASESWFYNADNMFVEWIMEGGIWLPPLLVVGLVVYMRALYKIKRRRGDARFTGVSAMGWYLIGAISVSLFFDFGILYPANYLFLAMLVGAVVGSAAIPQVQRRRRGTIRTKPQSTSRKGTLALLGSFGVAAIVWTATLETARQGAWADYQIRNLRSRAPGSLDYDEPRDARRWPDSPFLKIELAGALMADQREHALENMPRGLNSDNKKLYEKYSSIEYRRLYYYNELARGDANITPESALLPGQSIEMLRRARQLAYETLAACPLEVRCRTILLATSFIEPGSEALSQTMMDQAQALWPTQPSILTQFAKLGLPFPGFASSSPLIAEALRASPNLVRSVWPMLQCAASRDEMLAAIPDNLETLMVAIEFDQFPDSVRQRLVDRANTILKTEGNSTADPRIAVLRAKLALQLDDIDETAKRFAEAVRLNPSLVEVRFSYAQSLHRLGDTEAAIEQLKRCQIQSPGDSRFAKFMSQWQREADGE